MSRRVKRAGLAGIGLAGAFAGWAAVNRVAVKRAELVAGDPVAAGDLDVASDAETLEVPVSDGWVIRGLARGPADGIPVVMLHGVTLSARVWAYQLRTLPASGLRVIALDLRGHGGSAAAPGPGPADLTLDRLAADVEEVIEHLDLRHVVLVGHSMGGMVALRMMARDAATRAGRGRIAALGLVATAANASQGRGVPVLAEAVSVAQPLISRATRLAGRLPGPTLPAHDLGYLVARVTFGSGSSPRQVRFAGEMTSAVRANVSGPLLGEILRYDELRRLHLIDLPTAVVVGDHDLMTPMAQSEIMAEQIPGADLTVLAGCGHMVMLERPSELDRAVVALAEKAAGRAAAAAGQVAPAGTSG